MFYANENLDIIIEKHAENVISNKEVKLLMTEYFQGHDEVKKWVTDDHFWSFLFLMLKMLFKSCSLWAYLKLQEL